MRCVSAYVNAGGETAGSLERLLTRHTINLSICDLLEGSHIGMVRATALLLSEP